MQSYQNLKILQNLYKLKALGVKYIEPFEFNQPTQESVAHDIDTFTKQIQNCHLCDLSKSRRQSMSGFGSVGASVMFIDYVVSEMEDASNSYFTGRSGEMLKKMITNVLELPLEKIYYTHAIKCKPLHLKKELQSEWMTCREYLFSQISFVRPKVIVTLGEESFQTLLGDREPFAQIRGHIIEFKNTKLIPIYHPNFILRNPNMKKIVFNDLKTIKSCL